VGHAAQDEALLEVVEAVEVLEDQAELSQQTRVLEAHRQLGDELRHEERVVVGERRDEGRVEREAVLGRVTGAAGAAVPIEGLAEEDRFSSRHELRLGIRRRRVAGAGEQGREGGQARERRPSRDRHAGRIGLGAARPA
jgi:hypothetical protein